MPGNVSTQENGAQPLGTDRPIDAPAPATSQPPANLMPATTPATESQTPQKPPAEKSTEKQTARKDPVEHKPEPGPKVEKPVQDHPQANASPSGKSEPQVSNLPKTKKEDAPTPVEKPVEQTPAQQNPSGQPAAEAVKTEEEPAEPESKPIQAVPVQPKPEPVTEGMVAATVDSTPVPVNTPQPKIRNKDLKKLKAPRQVRVSYLVNHLGKVETMRFVIKSGVPEIDMDIMTALGSWTFKPAIKEGVAVRYWNQFTMQLNP